jgi:hypothetical protein
MREVESGASSGNASKEHDIMWERKQRVSHVVGKYEVMWG